MPAVINTAAKFYPQFTAPALSLDSSGNTVVNVAPLPCTIVKVLTGGSRVSVAIENPAQTKQTPSGAWATNNVPYVDTGMAPPTSGPFVTATDYVVPADGTTHLADGTPSSGPDGSEEGLDGGAPAGA